MIRLAKTTRRRDVWKPWLVFRSAESGQYVSRICAALHPKITVSERRKP